MEMSSENYNLLEYLADSVPAVFEDILLNLDRTSILNVMSTSRTIRRSVKFLIEKKRILPFKDTTVLVNKSSWALGFNTFKFYGFCESAPQEMKNTVQFRKPFGKGRPMEMEINQLANRIKYFAPKKYIFDLSFNPDMLAKHLEFMKQVEIETGTTTEIAKAYAPHIAPICAVIKPKKLILMNMTISGPDVFADESFRCVKHLCIREFKASRYYQMMGKKFYLEPISDSLVSYEFSGNLPEYPCNHINILLQMWCKGVSVLREVKVVIERMVAEEVMDDVLEDIQNTSVEEINQLPEFMQKAIAKDLIALDWETADIDYRLLLSPSKRQMGCIYFSKAIESSSIKVNPWNNVSSYFGFHAFDYFPVN